MNKTATLRILIGVCICVFFIHLDILYVNIMEARNFITAREMLQDDHWLLTTLNGVARYEKPPLPTWLTAFSGALFGIDNVAVLRYPAALMGLILVVFQYKSMQQLTRSKSLALVSGLILCTSFFILYAGRNGQWDIFTHAFMMICIYQLHLFFALPLEQAGAERRKFYYALLAGIFFGLSFMSKGPVSVYALFLPFILAYGFVFRFKELKSRMLPLFLFVIVATVISLWWYVYTYLVDSVAVAAVAAEESSNWANYNVKPFYYYWSFVVQSGLWTIPAFISLLYPYLKNRVRFKKAYTFTFLWTLFSVILLSIIPEKKSRYLLPVLIPLACNTAFYIDYLFRCFDQLRDRRETTPVFVNFGIVGIIGVLCPFAGYVYLGERLEGNWIWFILLSLTLFVIGFFLLKNLFRRKIEPTFYLTITFLVAVMLFGMPLAKTLTINEQYKSLSELPKWERQRNIKAYEFQGSSPELIWAYGSMIEFIFEDGQLEIPAENQFAVLVADESTDLFKKAFKDFSIQKVDHYDMNPKGPNDRSHKTRLWRDLYVVTKAHIALESSEAKRTLESRGDSQKTSR